LVKRPKANIPNNGPYVYPATVKSCSITLLSLIALKSKITANKIKENKKWTCFLVFTCFFDSFFLKSKISIQNAVVRDVSAESALEYAAAIIPIIKSIPI
tara:strand:- start:2260 stop:2559 length:300 start_codon:yes stop_codon:yes gene_type:complete